MFVSMWMTREVCTVGPDTPIVEVADLMFRRRIRRVPVVEPTPKGPKLEGIISATDILRAFPSETNPLAARNAAPAAASPSTARHVMTHKPFTTTAEAPIEEAARMMRDSRIGSLPVIRDGTLVGMITESDIFRAFVSIFESASPGARITFSIAKGEDVFPLVAQIAADHDLRVLTFVSLQKHERPVCVVEVTGAGAQIAAMPEDVWNSRHQVVSVIKLP